MTRRTRDWLILLVFAAAATAFSVVMGSTAGMAVGGWVVGWCTAWLIDSIRR